MDYISLINSFWDLASVNPLPTGQVSLYFALLHVCNRSYWAEWFEVPNQVLSVLTGMSRSGILKARNELKQKKVIDFKERGTKPTLYRITIANSKQVGNQDGVQNSKQVGNQDGVQNSVHILKHKQKTETLQHISPTGMFESFWACYPIQKNRSAAEKAYCDIIVLGIHTEDELVRASENYAEYCRLTGTDKIYHACNFLSKAAFEDYLPGRYRSPEKRERNAFMRMEKHDYDFDALERELLENGGAV